MSEHQPESGISDEQLPDDLVPGDDNPLAEGLDDRETVGDLLHDGKHAEQPEQPEQPDGARQDTSQDDEPDDGAS
jgi:hypothetical protein